MSQLANCRCGGNPRLVILRNGREQVHCCSCPNASFALKSHQRTVEDWNTNGRLGRGAPKETR
jgi:hypothetical protein